MSGLALTAPMVLIALAPLAAIIVALYLLKLRRRDVTVSSVFLWRTVLEDVQANAPFQRLRMSLLLLLQLIALAALVVGLAGPHVMARKLPGRTSVIVLDASASMGATDVEPMRFGVAVERARELVGRMTGADEAALIICGARPTVAVPLGQERRRLLAALEAAEVTDCPTNLREGLLLGASLTAQRPNAHLYLISDGAVDDLPELPGDAQAEFISVGERCDNVAILAFEATIPPGGAAGQLFLRLHNYADGARRCDLTIYRNDDVLDARRVEAPAGKDLVQTWEIADPGDALLRAEVEIADDLAADNVAWAQATAAGVRSVLLVGPGNLFLEQALMIQPGLKLLQTDALSATQMPSACAEYDLLIFDRVAIPAPPQQGAVLAIAADGWPELASPGESIEQPQIGSWRNDHPALRHVNLGAVGIAAGCALVPGAEATVLAEAQGRPMVVALEREGLRALALGWDLLDSDLPLRVGFPVLVSNLTRWLGGVRDSDSVRVIRPGATVRQAVAADVQEAVLEMPDGERQRIAPVGGEIVFAGSERVGVYRLSAGEESRQWTVDLRDAAESDLMPRSELDLGGRSLAAAEEDLRIERHLWPWLAVLALIALIAEWHLYHKRY